MMEIISQVSSTQFLFPAAAVAVVLVCAALVFMFGFHSAEQPQFDKLPLVVDDRKSSNKKRKTKEKKSSPNRTGGEDAKTKSDSSKKSPVKEKKEKEDKLKEEKPKVKKEERPTETKPIKKEKETEGKKGKKKGGAVNDADKPADFDEGVWEEVPKKSDKKKVKPDDVSSKKEKDSPKTSPAKKNQLKATKTNKTKEVDVEANEYKLEDPSDDSESQEQVIKVVSVKGPNVDEEAARALQKQVEELQRVLKERERQEQAALGGGGDGDGDEPDQDDVPEVKDLRANKKIENKEKQKKKNNEAAAKKADSVEKDSSDSDKAEEQPGVPVFDELGDTWTESKVTKKGKKKVRKDQ